MLQRRGCTCAILIAGIIIAAGCARPAPRFSVENARAHLSMLAGTIGCRAIGTPGNARARAYIVDQLKLFGYDVRVQETDARRPEFGLTAHVNNIIAIKPGAERGALGLVSHYDSAPESPGGGDDGIGVAVSLETARVLASRPQPRHTIAVLVTDGEEAGLMGAAALTADRDLIDRLEAYVNVEATGSSGTAMLFETGPQNPWIVKPWRASAPHPRGASFAVEIYKRLPNDTDFSIFKRYGIPGLNFAVIGDSYAYHTARDTADRVPDDTLRTTGENTVETMLALDARDLTQRTAGEPTYFDAGGTVAMSWGPSIAWLIAIAALACGTLAWVKVLAISVRLEGVGRWFFYVLWTVVGIVAVAAALVGGAWALRESRTVYHPWYAHPKRFFLLELALGTLAAWVVARLGMWIPLRARGPRHPVLAWSVTLPVWVLLAGIMASVAPAAGYLWTLPLLAAGACLLAFPVGRAPVVRAISVLVLAIAGTLWLQNSVDLLLFSVPLLGRLPIVTPVYAYALLMLAAGVMLVPPLVAAIAVITPIVRPSAITAFLLAAAVVTGILAYRAPAYTETNPQRREARVLVDPSAAAAVYEVAGQEPGLDLAPGAPAGWTRVSDAPPSPVPLGRLVQPFVFRTTAASPGPAPAAMTAFTLAPVKGGTELSMTVAPKQPGLTAMFVLPEGLKPARTNLPGAVVAGHWRAIFVAPPPEGVTWRASFGPGLESRLANARAVVTSARFPGGEGWQSLPAWLPQEHAVWQMRVRWILEPPIAPVPALR
ncbi:MAG TPA: M28 family peptidase [Vicinamibacterales bacterium]|nr:M28 family peptidase [Vicinamibacterales bacterium]